MEKELIVPLPNGGTLRCGEGDEVQWGGYLRICNANGDEVNYWYSHEWEEDPEGIIGAIFSQAVEGRK